jgi:hypothetical protein
MQHQPGIRSALSPLSQVMVMAAIVTTLLLLPFGAVLAWLCSAFAGVSLGAFVTFGHRLNGFEGLVAWWFLGFVPAFVYAAALMSWRPPRTD